MEEKERARVLELTLGQIEKQFGKGSILRLGSKDAIVPVMVKQTHHQRGARPSTTPEMRSVIQLKLRRFSTSGMRASGRSTVAAASPRTRSGAAGVSSIQVVMLSLPERPRQCSRRPASSGWHYEVAPDNSCALSHSNNRATDNCDRPLSASKLWFPGP